MSILLEQGNPSEANRFFAGGVALAPSWFNPNSTLVTISVH